MALSQSFFLQALGWATLNSFWQMSLLWCIYVVANHCVPFSAAAKYKFSVAAVITGFVWFIISFIFYKQQAFSIAPEFGGSISASNSVLNIFLISASAAYCVLLIFPAARLFRNWRFVQHIKKEGLKKANLDYRLFVQKISSHLTIGRKVRVFVSEIISSPLTIGYLKPIILLPVAALNHLSVNQVEAILLHELSHIKRLDYAVNFIVSIIHTILYFNPFVKLFVNQIEAERENCCDELVLQFGYDKVSYASALLTLEKSSSQQFVLALGLTGKQNLLTRIEKIVGMEQKKRYSLAQVLPVFGAVLCIMVFNSFLLIKDSGKKSLTAFESATIVNPLYLIEKGSTNKILNSPGKSVPEFIPQNTVASKRGSDNGNANVLVSIDRFTLVPSLENTTAQSPKLVQQVAADDIDLSLSADQKQQVKTTLDATKKVMKTLQWQQVESSIADVMNDHEKAIAKEQYMKEIDKAEWENIEKNLKANYDNINWLKVNSDLNKALTTIQLDSIQNSYSQILSQLETVERQISTLQKVSVNPLPDCSLSDIKMAKEQIEIRLAEVKALIAKPIIKL